MFEDSSQPVGTLYNVDIPYVIERTGRGEREYDIYSRLLKERIIFLCLPIFDEIANAIIAQMLYLQFDNKSQDISLYINSPHDTINSYNVTDFMAIYDTMQFVKCEIATYCFGEASSTAAILLASGTKGKRYILPNSRIMLYQPVGGARGTSEDIAIQAEEIDRQKSLLIDILAKTSGQKREKVAADIERKRFMSAEEAIEYGLADKIIEAPSI